MRTNELLASVAAAAITVAIAGPAGAADLMTKAPAAAPAFNWNGYYGGMHAGIGGGSMYNASTCCTKLLQGGVVGLHVGRNWVVSGNILWGIEADISAANIQGGTHDDPVSVDLMASIRGRLGMTFDRTLVYITGGGGLLTGRAATSTGGKDKRITNFRGVVGGGVEYALTNQFLVRTEGLVYLGSNGYTLDEPKTLGAVYVARVGLSAKF